MRYERGVDDHLCEVVSQAGGGPFWPRRPGARCAPAWWTCTSSPTARPELIFRIPRFTAMTAGSTFPPISSRTSSCASAALWRPLTTPLALSVLPPTFRPDLEREIDLYEEVLRLWGMDRIPPTLPGGRERVGARTPEQETVRVINDTLRASGMERRR